MILSVLFALASGLTAQSAYADKTSAGRIRVQWERYVKEPHPMGSRAQKDYGDHVLAALKSAGLKTRVHAFEATAPARLTEGSHGSKGLNAAKTVKEAGRNLVGTRAGPDDCALLLGGHYDSKEFLGTRFVGANDGGSSTVLLLELARQIGHGKDDKETYGACDVHFTFFDGEEAYLPEWDDGMRTAGVEDHLYGSTAFAQTQLIAAKKKGEGKGREGTLGYQGKPVALLALFDMVGHASQKLFVTRGSHEGAAAALIKHRGDVPLTQVGLGIDDDHLPFAKRGIAFVHVIDWTNLAEWHTPKDDLSIVSPEKVALLVKTVRGFLKEKRSTP